MAAVRLKCEIDGCGMSWSVPSPGKMKASMAEHRQKFHPDWVPPPPSRCEVVLPYFWAAPSGRASVIGCIYLNTLHGRPARALAAYDGR